MDSFLFFFLFFPFFTSYFSLFFSDSWVFMAFGVAATFVLFCFLSDSREGSKEWHLMDVEYTDGVGRDGGSNMNRNIKGKKK